MNKCEEIGIETKPGTVDVGVRVEVRDEVMQFLNENLYEAKLIYHTPTFDDKVRTFCTNPSGEVATEYYENGLAVVNGHAYKGKEFKTNNTNFALLVSKNFTKPFKTPIEYGKKIAELYGKDIENWIGKKITLYYDANVRVAGKRVGGTRVKAPAAAQNITYPKCELCMKDIYPAGRMSADETAIYTRNKYGNALCAECAMKAAQANKEAEHNADE